jgi:NTE family protein
MGRRMHLSSKRAGLIASGLVVLAEPFAGSTVVAQGEVAGRPAKVALVLSGGGTRGGAHIGVLRVLERAGVPVDLVVGTSIGALVGGLYATGYSPDDLEDLVRSLRWDQLFEDRSDRRLLNLNNKSRHDHKLFSVGFERLEIKLPTGFQEGQQIQQLVERLTAPSLFDAGYDFDRLPVRFRAIATDIVTGQRVVLDHGPLSLAIRASIAIPGLFTPLEYQGKLLVDGGLADNLPVEVARELGAELVIAVDVTTPLLNRNQIQSVVDVFDQAISFRIEEHNRQSRGQADLLITPELGDFDSSDFSRAEMVIKHGEQAALKAVPQLEKLLREHGVTLGPRAPRPPLSETLRAALDGTCNRQTVAVQQVRIEGLQHYPSKYASSQLELPHRESICWSEIDHQASLLYGTDHFRLVSYQLEKQPDRTDLVFRVREAPLTQLGIGAHYDQDYKFTVLLDLIDHNFLRSGSDLSIRWLVGNLKDLQIGLQTAALWGSRLNLATRFGYHSQERLIYLDGNQSGDYQDRRYGFALGLQYLLGNLGRIDLEYELQRVNIDRGSAPLAQASQQTLAGLNAALRIDTADDSDFPEHGMQGRFEYQWREPDLGSDFAFQRTEAALRRFITIGSDHTFEIGGSYGRTQGEQAPFYTLFYAGAAQPLEFASTRLIGLQRDEILADQAAMLNFSYRFKLRKRRLEGVRAVYLALNYDAGTFAAQFEPLQFGDFLHGYGLGIYLDPQFLGPIRYDFGRSQRHDFINYFSIGHRF